MGYLSCRADSSVATCRSITAISPLPISRRSSSGASGSRAPAPALPPAATIERFAYAELEAATSHFADETLLGRGSHGTIYKAVLPSGRPLDARRRLPLPISPARAVGMAYPARLLAVPGVPVQILLFTAPPAAILLPRP